MALQWINKTDDTDTVLAEDINSIAQAVIEIEETMVDLETEINTKTAPYIGVNGNWFERDAETQTYVDTGISAQGYTPQKGVDYWTAEDIAAIKNDVEPFIITATIISGELSGIDKYFDDINNAYKAGKIPIIKANIPSDDYYFYTLDYYYLDSKFDFSRVDYDGSSKSYFTCTNSNEGNYPGWTYYTLYQTKTSTTKPTTLAVNTIYDLGTQTNLSLNLPNVQLGSYIQVDFLSGEAPTTLTITSSSGLSEYDLVPEANMIYSLYFDWGVLYYDTNTSSYVYGWRFAYAEYVADVGV